MNRYCNRLEIAIPDVSQVWEGSRPKLFWMMVVCLLERGEPMTVEEIAARLDEIGVTWRSGAALRTALLKSWHGLAPIRKRADGRLGLDLDAWELGTMLCNLGLVEVKPLLNPPPEPVALPGPEVPLCSEELASAFEYRRRYSESQDAGGEEDSPRRTQRDAGGEEDSPRRTQRDAGGEEDSPRRTQRDAGTGTCPRVAPAENAHSLRPLR